MRSLRMLTLLGLGLAGCRDYAYEGCLVQAHGYETRRADCLKLADGYQQRACSDHNRMHRITPADCERSYK
jgi:hypothetical protein